MIVNTYDIELEKMNGDVISVSLRITLGAQIKLKKKFNESTITTLFSAIDDPERFAAVLDSALNWDGNQNEIKVGTDLADLMAINGLLGMVEKQRFITRLAVASGIISESEKAALDKKSDEYMRDMIPDDDEVTGKRKNA